MNDTMESRVSILEEKARAQTELNNHVSLKLDTIAAGVARLETMAALSVAKSCPAPGKCLELEQAVVKMQEEIDSIKDFIAQQKGGWKLLLALGGLASMLGAVVSWLLTHLTKGHGP